ncbi:MAG: hypothetical protein COT38_00990 [Candidatus Omnitrophica bacterium CG08_land_8_20_14_0_20_41_16]|uniref:Hydrogenase maturation factor HypA n=1 Tax=Candidatus Sherwoodlollariibacterium unditelluris TaxID=1974757 RepID=A0A2G9YIF9_9BACT|nr:MAG: hypothetical protein COX41_05225 [Candidatus Omnitrophica bacterium CG23_combo_of_CG06-09_8_20_14_all_41_10]PIS34271.1 MAG: hypothetical protein COT38_00990 [Candidatus Omnitrophica bacterium CG08_land_8_20_14_0_20_41_16]
MHDIMFAGRIVDLLKDKIGKGAEQKHIVVNIALGPFTHVTAESLRSAFRILIEKESLENVVLNIQTNDVVIKCKKCGASEKIIKPVAVCPECGWGDFEIENAEEFVIQSIEIKEA